MLIQPKNYVIHNVKVLLVFNPTLTIIQCITLINTVTISALIVGITPSTII